MNAEQIKALIQTNNNLSSMVLTLERKKIALERELAKSKESNNIKDEKISNAIESLFKIGMAILPLTSIIDYCEKPNKARLRRTTLKVTWIFNQLSILSNNLEK